jgi:hypothetical protein
MKFLTFNFNLKLFSYLVLGFILCTIVGTVSHEGGHCIAAKFYGRNPELSYAYMVPGEPGWLSEFKKEYEKNKDKIESKESSPEKEAFLKLRTSISKKYKAESKKEDFYITLGGPLQTMLTGMIGFIILFFRRKQIFIRGYLTLLEWAAVLLSYFWSREVFNFIFSIDDTFSDRKHFRSDEPRLSQYLNLPPWAFGMITCVIGGIILLWVTFRVIPVQQRLTFLVSGLIGSTIGWIVWMDWLGPILLP